MHDACLMYILGRRIAPWRKWDDLEAHSMANSVSFLESKSLDDYDTRDWVYDLLWKVLCLVVMMLARVRSPTLKSLPPFSDVSLSEFAIIFRCISDCTKEDSFEVFEG